MNKKKLPLIVIIILGILYGVFEQMDSTSSPSTPSTASISTTQTSQDENPQNTIAIFEAYQQQRSDVQVQGVAEVVHILPDDNEGSRHQKFIVKLSNGHTLLISHNIDLAPRINDLKKGDEIEFYGEYEWNDKGGVVHWTHLDPRNTHPHGWLKHNGKIYQ